MAAPKTFLVNLVAALAPADAAGRQGVNPFIPAMVVIGLVLAFPVFVLLTSLLQLLTRAHPLARQPWFAMGADSLGCGLIWSAELLRRWRGAIDAQLADLGALDPVARARQRRRTLLGGMLAAALLVFACLAVAVRP